MTFEEAKAKAKQWDQVSLLDKNKSAIVNYNPNKDDKAARLKEIGELLHTLDAGKYYLGVRKSVRSSPVFFEFVHGDYNEVEVISAADSYREELNVRLENERLKIENEALREKVKELNQLVTDLELELEDDEFDENYQDDQNLGANMPLWQAVLAEQLLPRLPQILDKFLTPKAPTNENRTT